MGFLEHVNLGYEEVDHRLLLAAEPAGQDDDEELPGLEDEVHAATAVGVGQCDRIDDLRRLSIGPDGRSSFGFSGSLAQDLRIGGLF
ncbi:MAG: hypothetical protein NTU53_06160 [Planctomycetota bacterium]|nr:hypothetical protein [Planctomycetota bacterium]